MYKRTEKEFVFDILIACERILKYTDGMDFETFSKDEKTIDAVVRNIEIIGEAVKNLSREFTEKYQEVEWKEIAKTRDKIIHFYFGVNLSIIWDIVTVDIPELKQKLENIIRQEGWQNES